MSKSLNVTVYVDDILIYELHNAEIDNLIEQLKNDNIAFHCKGTAESYLGVDIQRKGKQIMLKKKG
jgi:hypothetical protein